ncbi:MAG: hypothetical protein O3A00_07250, partial [Planctomycetota bacterium]|nr:hypothetical protein [Planctomycetota bacterium]
MSEHGANHPQLDVLVDFGLGKLELKESSWIEEHLSECSDCCDTLHNLADDTFTGIVRSVEPQPESMAEVSSDSPATICESNFAGDSQPASLPESHASGPGNVSNDSATVLSEFDGAPDGPDLPQDLLDHPRYRIVELIGKGGMGNVYRAEHTLMNRSVALKLINSQFVKHPQAVARFQREGQAAAQL